MSEALAISEMFSGIAEPLEQWGLSQWENVIERSNLLKGYALRQIRDKKFYLESHFTFKDYLRERWNYGESYGYELMKASEAVDKNSGIPEFLSTGHVSHVRELTSLEPQQQRQVWQTVLETAPEGKVTAAHIRTVVERLNDVEKEAVKAISKEITVQRAEENTRRLEQIKAQPIIVPDGKFQCLVIDPPWPMERIHRDLYPEKVGFDYPTMTEEELMACPYVPEKAADDCHLYLWTTHRFLPMAFRLAEHWGFKYQCLMTWSKNEGMVPYSWMYSTEHVLFCRKGSLQLDRLGLRLDFFAKKREQSRKPDEFYDLVRQASPGPRLDIFSREKREGFEQFGFVDEIAKFAGGEQ